MDAAPSDGDTVPYIDHQAFRQGLPRGEFRIVVNPKLARAFVVRRTHVDLISLTLIGIGAVLSLGGQPLPGLALVALGIVANRMLRRQAGRIVLHLALTDAAVYAEVTASGVMEVRRATG